MPSQKILKNLCVMVTRPQPQGQMLCADIQKLGGDVIYFPTLDIIPCHITLFLEKYDWAIFISPQSVYHSIHEIKTFPKNIAAIGKSTASVLSDMGFPKTLYPPEDHAWHSEGLLALPQFQDVTQQKIAIIKGKKGRELLTSVLTARGADVTEYATYERALPILDPDLIAMAIERLRSQTLDVIICTSSESLQNLIILLQDAEDLLRNTILLVISKRLQEQASLLGFKQIRLAKNASHHAILEILEILILETLVKRKIV